MSLQQLFTLNIYSLTATAIVNHIHYCDHKRGIYGRAGRFNTFFSRKIHPEKTSYLNIGVRFLVKYWRRKKRSVHRSKPNRNISRFAQDLKRKKNPNRLRTAMVFFFIPDRRCSRRNFLTFNFCPWSCDLIEKKNAFFWRPAVIVAKILLYDRYRGCTYITRPVLYVFV